jgi:hypothetical protein
MLANNTSPKIPPYNRALDRVVDIAELESAQSTFGDDYLMALIRDGLRVGRKRHKRQDGLNCYQ